MIGLAIDCNVFIVLPIWLKTGRSNGFDQGKMCAHEKIGRVSEVLRARAQFLQACYILFVDFILTLPFSINLIPIMSLRFFFRRIAKIGEFWNISVRLRFICRRCQFFVAISFILWSVLLYLSNKGIVVAVFFFFSFESCSLPCKLTLSICCSITIMICHTHVFETD